MDCSQYANSVCASPPNHPLPFSGFEVFVLVGFAVACVALGLLVRYSHRGIE